METEANHESDSGLIFKLVSVNDNHFCSWLVSIFLNYCMTYDNVSQELQTGFCGNRALVITKKESNVTLPTHITGLKEHVRIIICKAYCVAV